MLTFGLFFILYFIKLSIGNGSFTSLVTLAIFYLRSFLAKNLMHSIPNLIHISSKRAGEMPEFASRLDGLSSFNKQNKSFVFCTQ